MGYTIVFETKIVKLSDGRIIHFDRSGCNNDNAGRRKDEFAAKIYTEDDFIAHAEYFKRDNKPFKNGGEADLKIGSRWISCYDYGEHLLRMLKRAKPYEEFIQEYSFRIDHLKGIRLAEPYEKVMSAREFDDKFYDLLHESGHLTYQSIIENPDIDNESNLVNLIESGEPLSFEIIKNKKIK